MEVRVDGKASNVLCPLSSARRAEYKAYAGVKPTRMIRAKSQYLPPDEKTRLETSYSATFKAQAPTRGDKEALDRRRVRSLYSDPSKQVRLIPVCVHGVVLSSVRPFVRPCAEHLSERSTWAEACHVRCLPPSGGQVQPPSF